MSRPWARTQASAICEGVTPLRVVAPAADGAADEFLVLERPVRVGRVQEGDAEIERAMNGGDRLLLVGRAIELAHAHAAETDRRHAQCLPECSLIHTVLGNGA